MEITVTLEPEGDGTRLSQVMLFPTSDALEHARTYQFELRGQETLAKLAALVERQGAVASA
jgi:uncharacterized protein YndB with AHSA1/START domain